MPERKPFQIRATLRTSVDARRVVGAILSEFPLACTDESDEESVIAQFHPDIDENGRTRHAR